MSPFARNIAGVASRRPWPARPSERWSHADFDRLRLSVSVDNDAALALYRQLGYADVGIPPRRVHGTIRIRTGTIEVDDTLLTLEKSLEGTP